MGDNSGKERRKFERVGTSFSLMFGVKSPFEVQLKLGARELDAVTQDISEGGLCMWTNYNIPIGARLNIKFKLFNDVNGAHRSFELFGDVCYCGQDRGSDYRIGVEFSGVTPEDHRFISEYIRMNKLEPGRGA